MKWVWISLFLFFLSACAPKDVSKGSEPVPFELDGSSDPTRRPDEMKIALEDLGLAPELENEVWLNVNQPLRLAELRGKVVLLDMWTFG